MAAVEDALSSGRITAPVQAATAERGALSPGSLIAEKYLLEAIIGEGAMGVVMRARHLGLRESVALKVLRPELVRDARAVSRFLREARALARLRTDHVARVMDVGTLEDGTPFLVMELLEGRDLAAELAERGTLELSAAIEIACQVCAAMQEAHAIGVVHRDLKPSNVFLGRRPDGGHDVKVIDFGIARGEILADEGEADLTAASCVLGSPAYMSPEQVRSADLANAQSDVWSLGIMLYEMLAGQPPFGSGQTTAVLAAICGDQPRPLCEVSRATPAVAAMVERCLSKNPEHRFASMKELSAALREAEAAPLAPARRLASLPRVVKRVVALAGVAGLSAALLHAALRRSPVVTAEAPVPEHAARSAPLPQPAPSSRVAGDGERDPKLSTPPAPASAAATGPRHTAQRRATVTKKPAAAPSSNGDFAAAIRERK